MARHIMAVCVVCLLCADRIPCEQHIEDSGYSASIDYQRLNAKVFQRLDSEGNYAKATRSIQDTEQPFTTDKSYSKHRHHTNNVNSSPHALLRRKRHAGHSHDGSSTDHRPEITQDFLQRIINEKGQGDGTLTIIEFRNILTQLGLHRLVKQQPLLDGQRNSSDTCVADINLLQHVQKHDLSHDHHDHHDHSTSEANGDSSKNCSLNTSNGVNVTTLCAPSSNERHAKHGNPEVLQNYSLSEEDVLNLCPVLLYQLASTSTLIRQGCIENDVLLKIAERSHEKLHTGKEDIVFVWTYAFISVFACGILGLVGVAIIPFMDSRYYKHIIQYLVSLAVGTMTGDALLHLLPHSLAGQSESGMIYKGLTCMGGIIFFYITEHGLTMISEWRKRKAKKDTNPSRAKVVRDPDSSITNSVAGDKLCKSKYSSYPYCYDEIAMDTKNDIWMHLPNNTTENRDTSTGTGSERKRNGRAEANANEIMAAQSLLSTSQNNYAPMTDMNNHRHQHQQRDHQQQSHPNQNHYGPFEGEFDHNSLGDGNVVISTSGNGASSGTGANSNNAKDKHSNDTVTVILREHESSHHGHSHKHGHVHSPPESLSAVAWMIIMGDGLHNFTDGMAIGAAFAENIAGGFSTSLAVFCHELPHELGDFAILMKAGMSVKSAVYYNLLTGVLSFIGMIFGIVFGQSQAAAQWMFAAAAGLFIYIALVDMMPELSAAHKSLEQLALQIFGMSTGVFLMLLIAIFEGDLMNIFSSSSSSSSSSSPITGTSSMTSFEPASGH